MAGFEPGSSGIRSDRSANCATTTAWHKSITLYKSWMIFKKIISSRFPVFSSDFSTVRSAFIYPIGFELTIYQFAACQLPTKRNRHQATASFHSFRWSFQDFSSVQLWRQKVPFHTWSLFIRDDPFLLFTFKTIDIIRVTKRERMREKNELLDSSAKKFGASICFFGPKPASFCLFSLFSQDKYSTKLTINDKSVDGMLGT